MKGLPIQTQEDLKRAFYERVLVGKRNDYRWGIGADEKVFVDFDGLRYTLQPVYVLRPTIRDLASGFFKAGPGSKLLVTVQLTGPVLGYCREQRISCVDLNGQLYLRAKCFLLERAGDLLVGRPGEKRPPCHLPVYEPNVFTAKGSRLPRLFLCCRRKWTLRSLALESGLSLTLVARLIRQMSAHGWIGGTRGDWHLTSPDRLLTEWATADQFNRRVKIQHCFAREKNSMNTVRGLADHFKGEKLSFTQWPAYRLRHPPVGVPFVSVYVPTLPASPRLETLGLEPVPAEGNVRFLEPEDPGVFQYIRWIDGIPLVGDCQIFLDLLPLDPDQADAFRKNPNFCGTE